MNRTQKCIGIIINCLLLASNGFGAALSAPLIPLSPLQKWVNEDPQNRHSVSVAFPPEGPYGKEEIQMIGLDFSQIHTVQDVINLVQNGLTQGKDLIVLVSYAKSEWLDPKMEIPEAWKAHPEHWFIGLQVKSS